MNAEMKPRRLLIVLLMTILLFHSALTFPSLTAQRGAIYQIVFSRSGDKLAYTRYDEILFWDWKRGEKISSFRHTAPIASLVFSGDENHVLFGDDNGGVYVWSLATGKTIRTFHFPSGNLSADISPDGKYFLIGNFDGQIFLGETNHWKILRQLDSHNFAVRDVRFTLDSRLAFSAGWDQMLKRHNFINGPPSGEAKIFKSGVRGLKAHLGMINCVAVTGDGKRILTGSYCDGAGYFPYRPKQDEVLKLWDVSTGNVLLGMSFDKGVLDIETSPVPAEKKAYLITAARRLGPGGFLYELDIAAWKAKEVLTDSPLRGEISAIALHPSEPVIALGTLEGNVLFFNRQNYDLLAAPGTMRKKS
ncbi:MAG: hypothetical protein HYZ84_06715 [Candidatus Omnitrophica bacterium]|nr:hypothetical protein [Candidatus Omnitrophota bacterium]